MKPFWFIFILQFFNSANLIAQHSGEDFSTSDTLLLEDIQTIIFHREGWPLSWPVAQFGTGDKLRLSFDDVSENARQFSWEIIHCSSSWVPDLVYPTEYIDGFPDQQIPKGLSSFNTTIPYYHYSLLIPGDDYSFLSSGNYLIRIYLEESERSIVFQRRFVLYENLCRMDIHPILSPSGYSQGFQGMEGRIELPAGIPFNQKDISMAVFQNFCWKKGIYPAPIQQQQPGIFIFNSNQELAFPGRNEFLNVDIKSLSYLSPEIQNIEFEGPYYRIHLHPDKTQAFKDYFFENDLNGRFLIENNQAFDSRTGSDYVLVDFSLQEDIPLPGDVFIAGAFTGYSLDPTYKMGYSFEKKTYELSLRLKQGYYNYEYLFLSKESPQFDFSYINGNHHETENDYLFFVYFYDPQKQLYRVIGYTLYNSLRR